MIKDLILKNRSYRRFHESERIRKEVLLELVDTARLSMSANNFQSMKYIISHTHEKNALIFPKLRWAGYIKDWPGPAEGERPAAYIIILGDKEISQNFYCDHGIVAENIMLAATEMGFNGCMLGSIDRDLLRKDLNIAERYEILLCLALGKASEKVKIDLIDKDGDIKYWRDEKSVHHVPKRKLEDIIIE